MAVQPTPPIQLDPSMDTGHQLAFINQNFNNIANVIQQNSFVILKSGTFSILAPANNNNTTTVPHNLGFLPIPLCFLSTANNTVYYPLPQWTSASRDDVNSVVKFSTWIDCNVDSTNLYIDFINALPGANGPFTIKYFLLQQTAN